MLPLQTILIGLGLLLMLGLVTIWHGLWVKVKALRAAEQVAMKGFHIRHDLIPLLVERYEATCHGARSVAVKKLVAERGEVRLERNMKKRLKREEALEASLKQLVKEGKKAEALEKDVGWLEARTELQKITVELGGALEQIECLRGGLAAESLRFPSWLFRPYTKRYL